MKQSYIVISDVHLGNEECNHKDFCNFLEWMHGTQDPLTNVTNDDPIMTGKIALAHLNEFPDYYDRLEEMEEEAEEFWENK